MCCGKARVVHLAAAKEVGQGEAEGVKVDWEGRAHHSPYRPPGLRGGRDA